LILKYEFPTAAIQLVALHRSEVLQGARRLELTRILHNVQVALDLEKDIDWIGSVLQKMISLQLRQMGQVRKVPYQEYWDIVGAAQSTPE
jgi:hypothetical protein